MTIVFVTGVFLEMQPPVRARRIALIYLLAGAAWIVLTDAAMKMMTAENALLFSMVKGIIFIALTAIGLYLALSRWDSQRQRMEDRLRRASRTDPLTGLLNRAAFTEALAQALARARRGNAGSLGLLFLDLDGFKDVNDGYGHGVGDLLLMEVAARLNLVRRETDTVGRFGGDEFLLLLDDPDAEAGSRAAAERLVETMRAPFFLAGQELHLSVSIGVAQYPEDGGTPEELIRNADQAMYEAKSGGKNAFRRYRNPMPQPQILSLVSASPSPASSKGGKPKTSRARP